jgi:hypothetical protein
MVGVVDSGAEHRDLRIDGGANVVEMKAECYWR